MYRRIKRIFVPATFILFFLQVSAQAPIGGAVLVNDKLSPASSAHLAGFIGARLDASITNRILVQDVARLTEPFKQRNETWQWQTEFWGKWITSAILAYRYQPDAQLKSVIDQAVSGLVNTQTADGYIGNYEISHRLQQWDIWGRKYCLLGLLDYYDLTGDKASLRAARRSADFLMAELAGDDGIIVTKGNHRGMAASSVLEPVCRLYSRTGDSKYLRLAEEIARQWETPEGPALISKASVDVGKRFPKPKNWFSWEQGQKAYEMMSCYEGLLELYRITGNENYKQAVVKTWDNILRTEINVVGSGSAMEAWFGGKQLQIDPIAHYQETCVTVTWIKLSQQLLRLTGEAKYADAIEQSYYNALLGSMHPDGSTWVQYTPLQGQRLLGIEQCGMGMNCCIASGPRGLFTWPLTAVMASDSGLQVNFFSEGTYSLHTPSGQEMTLQQKTDYPVSGNIHMLVNPPKPESFTVCIRIPAWSARSVLTVNGDPVEAIHSGEYVQIKHLWKTGDEIQLELDMRGHVETMGGTNTYVAIRRGPVWLARDTRLSGPDLAAIVKPISDGQGYIGLTLKQENSQGIWMQFETTCEVESYTANGQDKAPLWLCDYASAGNSAGLPFFKVWMPQLIDPQSL